MQNFYINLTSLDIINILQYFQYCRIINKIYYQMENSQVLNTNLIQSQVSNKLPQRSSRQNIQGQSRIQYIPYEKTVIQYQPITKIQYIPRQKKVVEYYPVQYQTQYVPQVYHEKVIQYVPVERLEQRIQYVPVERQIHHPPQQQPYQVVQQQSYNINNSKVSPTYHPINVNSSRVQSQYVEKQQYTDKQGGGNISFQPIQYPAPHNNSFYTKQPLPSSKRQQFYY